MLKTGAIASALTLVATSIGHVQAFETKTRNAIDSTESKAEAKLLLVQASTPSVAVAQSPFGHREDREFQQDAQAATGTPGVVANVNESLAVGGAGGSQGRGLGHQ
ncbi:hypothetical protein FI667_g9647, partial [Globisporangium splendens]